MTVKIYCNTIAVCVDTSRAYNISGVYDVDGNIRREWKFRKAYQAEADLQPDGTVIIKFEP